MLPLLVSAAELPFIGQWMAVGDSITHGTYSYSYRWYLQKNFIDAGVSFDAVGCRSGCYTPAYNTAEYRGRSFDNEHSAQFNIWADEISGQRYRRRQSVEGMKSQNFANWLGLSRTLTPNAKGERGSYEGAVFSPDTITYMLGTNDLNGLKESSWVQVQGAVRQAAADAAGYAAKRPQPTQLVFMSVTCTGAGNPLAERIASHNAWLRDTLVPSLQEQGKLKVRYADINAGLQDVTRAPGMGVPSLYAPDRLHPNNQAALLVAGNLGRSLGLPGRTLGLPRRALSPAVKGVSAKLKKGKTWQQDWKVSDRYTVDMTLSLGNGDKDGWDTEHALVISMGNGSRSGTLKVDEAYIRWGDAVLCSRDMSAPSRLRVVWLGTEGDVPPGFYVWLDGMLIGEALPAEESSLCAVRIRSANEAVKLSLSLAPAEAFAPGEQ